jgi:hypothetical protein
MQYNKSTILAILKLEKQKKQIDKAIGKLSLSLSHKIQLTQYLELISDIELEILKLKQK